LTTKHIDTVELLKHTKCEATHPRILKPAKGKTALSYKAPVKDFTLSSYQFKKGETISLDIATAEIFLLMQGKVALQSKRIKVTLERPDITAVAFAGATVTVKALEDSWLFKAAAR